MSTTIDQKVVEMRFDNKHFESNVSTTMSTLDKLKQKLNFSGASKSLDGVSSAAKNVNMSPLSSAVESVGHKFSALEVMGITALSNITNSAVNAGKRIVDSLTLAPVREGFSEYEMTLNAVQTTMAGTGKTADEVQAQLKLLDEYADKTVYSTADMLNNLPKFTNAGVELETATTAMIGIANATALAGGDASKASIAFYNLGQSIGTGYLSRMDYNSINNAGIATMEWKEAMVEAAIAQGTLTKVGEDSYQAGNKTMSLQQLFIDGLQEQWATTDVLLKVFGDYGDETTEVGKKAYSAAQDLRTYTMMMDSLKATVGTGWKDTWEILIGDLDEAKELWTELGNFLSGIFTKMSDARNFLLRGALDFSTPWSAITDKLDSSGLGKIKKVAEAVEDVTDKVEYFQDIVNRVWRGDFATSDTGRYEMLEAAGYDHRVVQDLVNKGYQYEITVEDIEASHAKFGLTMKKNAETTEEVANALGSLSDEQLVNAGLTEDEIKLYREMEAEAARTGVTVDELAKKMSERDGRELLIDSLRNAGSGLVGVFKAIGQAWNDIFPPMSVVRLYSIIEGINKFSEKLRLTDKDSGKLNETGEKLKRTFKGIFAALDIIFTLIAGPFKIAFKAITYILGAFGIDILDVTAAIGDAIVKFRDWIDEHNIFKKAIDNVVPKVQSFIETIKAWIAGLKETDNVPKYIAEGIANGIGYIAKGIKNLILSIIDGVTGGFSGAGGNIVSGLVNGIWDGVKLVGQVVIELGKIVLEKIKGVLGIHSPSTEFFDIGKNIVLGLYNGIKDTVSMVWDLVKSSGNKIIEIIQGIDIGKVLSVAVSSGLTLSVFKIADGFQGIGNMFDGLGEMFEGVGDVLTQTSKAVKSFSKVMKSASFYVTAQGIKALAISLLIFVGAIIILTFIDTDKLWDAVLVVLALAGIMAALAAVVKLLASPKLLGGSTGIVKMGFVLAELAIAMILMAVVIKILAGVTNEESEAAFTRLLVILGIVIGALALCGVATKGSGKGAIKELAKLLRNMAITMLLMLVVIKIVSGMKVGELAKGIIVIALFAAIMAGLVMAAGKVQGKHKLEKLSSMLIAASAAMVIMALAVRILAGMSVGELTKGLIAITIFAGIIAGLMFMAKLAGKDLSKLGSTLIGVAVALGVMALVVRIIASMDAGDLAKGLIGVTLLSAMLAGLIFVTKFAGKDMKGLAATLIAVSVAIAILVGVIGLIGLMDMKVLLKGLAVVVVLGLLMAALIASTKGAKGCHKNIIAMTVAIGVMAIAVAALTLIDSKKLAVSVGALTILMLAFSLMIKSAKKAKKVIGTLITITAIIAALAGILVLMSLCDTKSALPNALALGVLLTAMSGSIKLLDKVTGINKGVIKSMALLGLVVAEIAIILGVMDLFGVKTSLKNVVSLSALLLVMSYSMEILDGVRNVNNSVIKSMALLGLVVAEIAIILSVMSALNIEASLVNVVALSAMLLAMSASLVILDKVGDTKPPTKAIGCMALLGLVVAELALVMKLIDVLDLGVTADAMIGLANVLLLLSVALVPLALVGKLGAGAFVGIGALAALIGALGVILAALGGLEELTDGTLGELLDKGLPLLEKIGYALGSFIGNFIGAIGVALTESLVTIGENLSLFMDKAEGFINGCRDIGKDAAVLMGAKTLAETVLEFAKAGFLNGIAEIITFGKADFVSIGTDMSKFATEIGGFLSVCKRTKPETLENAKTLAETIGIFTDSKFTDGLANLLGADKSIEKWAKELPALGEGLQGFKDALTLTEEDLAIVGPACEAIKNLAIAADTIPNEGGLMSAIFGENSMSDFAKGVTDMVGALDTMVTALKEVEFDQNSVDLIDLACQAIERIAEANNAIPNDGGIWGKIVGNNNMSEYAKGVKDISKGLVAMKMNLTEAGFDEGSVTLIGHACDAIKLIGDANDAIPNEGGWLGKLIGDNDIETFAAKLPAVGYYLSVMASNLEGFGGDQTASIKLACEVITAMANAAKNCTTGWWTNLFGGGEDFGSFIKKLPYVGYYMKAMAYHLGTFTDTQASSIKCACDAITALANASAAVESDGWLEDLFGSDDFGDFIGQLPEFGKALNGFMTAIGSFTSEHVAAVQTAMNAVEVLSSLGEEELGALGEASSGFGDDLASFAGNLATFISVLSQTPVSKTKLALGVIDEIASTFENVSESSLKNLKSFGSALEQIGKDGFSSFVTGLSGVDSTSEIVDAVNGLASIAASAFVDTHDQYFGAGVGCLAKWREGFESEMSDVSKAATTIVDTAVAAAGGKSVYEDFYSAGAYVGDGFVDGIDSNILASTTAGRNLADAAIAAAKAALDENSPSKVFYGIGAFAGIGFVNALTDYVPNTRDAGSAMAESARTGLSRAISKIRYMVDSDIDVQPTIAPVLDLSNVESGMGYMDSMFDRQHSVDLMANVGAISTMMSKSGQNGRNDDVVSAINKLRKDLGETERATYNINGITYDDDSAVTDAIATIVRAAKRERRV